MWDFRKILRTALLITSLVVLVDSTMRSAVAAEGRVRYWRLAFDPPIRVNLQYMLGIKSIPLQANLALRTTGDKVSGTINWQWGPGPDDGPVYEQRVVVGSLKGNSLVLSIRKNWTDPFKGSGWHEGFTKITSNDKLVSRRATRAEYRAALQNYIALANSARALATKFADSTKYDLTLEGEINGSQAHGIVKHTSLAGAPADGKVLSAPANSKFVLTELTKSAVSKVYPPLAPESIMPVNPIDLDELVSLMVSVCLNNAGSCAALCGDNIRAIELFNQAGDTLRPFSDTHSKYIRTMILESKAALDHSTRATNRHGVWWINGPGGGGQLSALN